MSKFLDAVWRACMIVDHGKQDQKDIMLSVHEEGGELAQEIKIAHGLRKGPAGPDGVIGEAIDGILCNMDIIYTELKKEAAELEAKTGKPYDFDFNMYHFAAPKLQKWLAKKAALNASK